MQKQINHILITKTCKSIKNMQKTCKKLNIKTWKNVPYNIPFWWWCPNEPAVIHQLVRIIKSCLVTQKQPGWEKSSGKNKNEPQMRVSLSDDWSFTYVSATWGKQNIIAPIPIRIIPIPIHLGLWLRQKWEIIITENNSVNGLNHVGLAPFPPTFSSFITSGVFTW